MGALVLKCWNGIYGCSSFEVIGWQHSFKDILEAGAWYKDIWNHCWIEDACGNVLYSIPDAEKRQTTAKNIIFNKLYEIIKGGEL
jgi:hypothetical protein